MGNPGMALPSAPSAPSSYGGKAGAARTCASNGDLTSAGQTLTYHAPPPEKQNTPTHVDRWNGHAWHCAAGPMGCWTRLLSPSGSFSPLSSAARVWACACVVNLAFRRLAGRRSSQTCLKCRDVVRVITTAGKEEGKSVEVSLHTREWSTRYPPLCVALRNGTGWETHKTHHCRRWPFPLRGCFPRSPRRACG